MHSGRVVHSVSALMNLQSFLQPEAGMMDAHSGLPDVVHSAGVSALHFFTQELPSVFQVQSVDWPHVKVCIRLVQLFSQDTPFHWHVVVALQTSTDTPLHTDSWHVPLTMFHSQTGSALHVVFDE